MTPLEEIIAERIKNEGPMPFRTFMEMALYHPQLGYYSSPERSIGRAGDFYTSPHLHPVFGAMIGRQLVEMWLIMGKPEVFHAVEMGAGMGYLCRDILEYLNKSHGTSAAGKDTCEFLKALRYVMVEPYEHFRQQQKNLLANVFGSSPLPATGGTERTRGPEKGKGQYTVPVSWTTSMNKLNALTGCILSNELLDALPVHVVEVDRKLKEVYVNNDGSKFFEELKPLSSGDLADYVRHFAAELSSGYRTEVNLEIRDWLRDISRVIERGFLLTIDYGYSAQEYYSQDRTAGTLLCYHNHLFNDNPYQNIGEQDITAHVNFSSLRSWGQEYGLRTLGYCPQGTYLTAAGIDEVITELYAGSADYLSEVSKIKGLIMPQGMGESHSVMIQYKGEGMPELRGFSMRNNVGHL